MLLRFPLPASVLTLWNVNTSQIKVIFCPEKHKTDMPLKARPLIRQNQCLSTSLIIR